MLSLLYYKQAAAVPRSVASELRIVSVGLCVAENGRGRILREVCISVHRQKNVVRTLERVILEDIFR